MSDAFPETLTGSCMCGAVCCTISEKPLTTEPDLTPELSMVKAGGIDSNEWFQPMWELLVRSRRPWVAAVPGAKQFEGNPVI